MENIKTTSFLGIVNGVQYDNVQDFQQALKTVGEPNSVEYTIQPLKTVGEPNSVEDNIQPIVRPVIYSTDADYIIPKVTEFHFEKLPDCRADVTKKLEQRMAYFTQEFSNGNIQFNTLQCLIDKAKQGIIDIQHHLDELTNVIDFVSLRAVNISKLVEEKVATADVLGFYVAMLDNFEDCSKSEIPLPKVPIPETTDVVDSILTKIKDLDVAQIDELIRALQNI